MKISVIVPVFNAEKFISKCVGSIINQTYTDWELLLVDDGSSDQSGLMCDVFSKKDLRIKTIHKNNGGVSSARNVGVKNATGQFLVFLDADDTLSPFTLEKCSLFFDCDVVRFSMKEIYCNHERIIDVNLQDDIESFRRSVIAKRGVVGVCGGMYKINLFTINNIFFDEQLKKAEDWKVLFLISQVSKKIKIIREPLYEYNKTNECSCTHSFSIDKELDSVSVLLFIRSFLGNRFCDYRNDYNEAKLSIYHKIVSEIAISKLKFNEVNEIIKNLKNELGSISVIEVLLSKKTFGRKLVDVLSLKIGTRILYWFVFKIKYCLVQS